MGSFLCIDDWFILNKSINYYLWWFLNSCPKQSYLKVATTGLGTFCFTIPIAPTLVGRNKTTVLSCDKPFPCSLVFEQTKSVILKK